MIADFPKQIEIKFWDVAIPAMSTNKFIQKVVRTTYQIVTDPELRRRSTLIITGSVIGFLTGLILFAFVL
jgi:hypothetical protein